MSRLLATLIYTTVHSVPTPLRFETHPYMFDYIVTAFSRQDMKYFSSEIHTNLKYISSENRLNT
jgi:hypothetical protein